LRTALPTRTLARCAFRGVFSGAIAILALVLLAALPSLLDPDNGINGINGIDGRAFFILLPLLFLYVRLVPRSLRVPASRKSLRRASMPAPAAHSRPNCGFGRVR
jgi:hypothetical protein